MHWCLVLRSVALVLVAPMLTLYYAAPERLDTSERVLGDWGQNPLLSTRVLDTVGNHADTVLLGSFLCDCHKGF